MEGKKIKELLKNKKVLIILALLAIIIGFKIAYDGYGIGMSDDTKQEKIMDVLANKDYEKAREKTGRLLKNNTKLKNFTIELISLYEGAGVGTSEEYSSYLQQLTQKAKEMNVLKIEKVNIVPKKYGEYHNVDVTVRNTGNKNISYIKINLYFKDKDGNIIASDWTNDDNIILPNAQQTISKMVSNKIGYHTVTAEIEEFNYIK